MKPLHARLHKGGWARLINCQSNNMSLSGRAYIETRGPRWLGPYLYRYVVRTSSLIRADWDTVQVISTERHGRYRYRWLIKYQRTIT